MLESPSSVAESARRTLKNNHLYLVDNHHGTIPYQNNLGMGLYHLDTRFLSCFHLKLNDTHPVPLLSSSEPGHHSTLVYTNSALQSQDTDDTPCTVAEETLQIKRDSILFDGLLEKFSLINYNPMAIKVQISFQFQADFRDIFEVRHLVPSVRGQMKRPQLDLEARILTFSYIDATGTTLKTQVHFTDWVPTVSFPEGEEGPVQLDYETLLEPLAPWEFNLEIRTVAPTTPKSRKAVASTWAFPEAVQQANLFHSAWSADSTEFETDNEDFNELLTRSHKDIRMLLTQDGDDTYIAAGIPWYTCLFGRDSLITSRDCLILNPSIAEATLKILAKHQGKSLNPERDEAPGKILHELRVGELARLGEIPHTPYYGSVDATPLWIILLHDYFRWTQDFRLLEALWPHVLMAMDWIDAELEQNPFGYLTYQRQTPKGLWHQGWKDSSNSAMYPDGVLADPPIALSEVQGYVYLAKRHLMALAEAMGQKGLKTRMKQEALTLKNRFNKDFWDPKLGFCALGLDSDGKPLRVIASNPGHCLETGILTAQHAKVTAKRLMQSDMFNGWGIRTLSSAMKAYNPMSYHNGSVWPHDNALIARGFAAMGQSDAVDQVFTGLFEAARQMSYRRLPELFCGFSRDADKSDPPVRYPVACSPQAWAASSVFSLTQSLLNLSPELENRTLKIRRPKLPHWINRLRVRNLKVGNAVLDLEFKRAQQTVLVDVLDRQGKLDLLIEI